MNLRSCRIAGLVGLFIVPLGCGSSDSGSAIQSGGSGGLGGYSAVGGTSGAGTAGYGYTYGGASGYGWGGANLGGYATGSGGFLAGGNTGTLGGSSGNGGTIAGFSISPPSPVTPHILSSYEYGLSAVCFTGMLCFFSSSPSPTPESRRI